LDNDGVAKAAGQVVAYLASLGGSAGAIARFLMDWSMRELRRPSALRGIGPQRRATLEDTLAWRLWLATSFGAIAGVILGLVLLAIGLIER
jgi:hypothetical protein